jgi:hypothetical protein
VPDIEQYGSRQGAPRTAGEPAIGPAGSGTAATPAREGMESIRAQFVAAFTPGKEWTNGASGDIGLIH